MAVFGMTKEVLFIVVPFFGFYLGHCIDLSETLRMTRFRDKSALYGRHLKEGEEPTWP